ncbi:MAG: RHS repeat domain-containing protein [Chloroflexota bacterium]
MLTSLQERGTTDYTYTYDDAYRLTAESYNTGMGNVTTAYQYDRAGNRTREIAPNGDITRYSYNPNDELTRVDYTDYSWEEYTYDERGNVFCHLLSNDRFVLSFAIPAIKGWVYILQSHCKCILAY